MYLLLHQVLDATEQKIAGLVPNNQTAACHAPAASTSDRIQSSAVFPLDKTPHRGTGTSVISESTIDRTVSNPDIAATVPVNNLTDSVAPVENSLSRRTSWRSLSRTSKSASTD
jgi:hypothetical protein